MDQFEALSTPDQQPAIGDGTSILIGSLAGALGGLLLGLLIAWSLFPRWSLTSWIVVAHVTLAMVAMGAWTGPSLASDPEKEEGHLPAVASTNTPNAAAH